MTRDQIAAVCDDVLAECRAHDGIISAEIFDAIFHAHRLTDRKTPPSPTSDQRSRFMGRRNQLRQAVRYELGRRGLWLEPVDKATNMRGCIHRLMDGGAAQVKHIKEAHMVIERAAKRHSDGIERFAASPLLRQLPETHRKALRRLVIEEGKEKARSLRRSYEFALEVTIGSAAPPSALPPP